MSKDRIGAFLILTAGLLLVLTLGTGALLETAPRSDAIGPERTETVVLLDLTDPFTPEQVCSLHSLFVELEAELRRGETLSAWVLACFPEGELRHVFSRRYPGRDANPLIANPRLAALRCDSLFSIPLARSVAASLPPSGASSTPVLECIRDVSETDFHRGVRHRFILVSDLAENSTALTFYAGVPKATLVRSTQWYRQFHADLRGTSVDVVEIARAQTPVTERLQRRAFWKAYLEACGAASIVFRRL